MEAIRLSIRKVLYFNEIEVVRLRFFNFVAYYEKTFYRYDVDRILACLPTIHQLRHVHEALRDCGPSFLYAQWCIERINRLITQAIRSKGKPNENVATKLELDTHCSLLPYVIPDMETVIARDSFTDKDGRLLLPKLLRHMVLSSMNSRKGTSIGPTHEAGGPLVPGVGKPQFGTGMGTRCYTNNTFKAKEQDAGKLNSVVLESILTDYDNPGWTDEHQAMIQSFSMSIEDIQREFGIDALTNTDMRRALRRIGDVVVIDQVGLRQGGQLLEPDEYDSLLQYLRHYFTMGQSTSGNSGNSPVNLADVDDLFRWEDEEGVHRGGFGYSGPFFKGQHHESLNFQKWRNIRFEKLLKIGDYLVDRRVVRICGSRYPRMNKTRSSSFFEFSLDPSITSGGTHTAGQERASCSFPGSKGIREFAEALFFVTFEVREKTFFLCYASPLVVRFEEGLTIVERARSRQAGDAAGVRGRNNRRYAPNCWLDVEDFVDLIGLIRCEEEDYVCWRDACWDAVERIRLDPLVWDTVGDSDASDLDGCTGANDMAFVMDSDDEEQEFDTSGSSDSDSESTQTDKEWEYQDPFTTDTIVTALASPPRESVGLRVKRRRRVVYDSTSTDEDDDTFINTAFGLDRSWDDGNNFTYTDFTSRVPVTSGPAGKSHREKGVVSNGGSTRFDPADTDYGDDYDGEGEDECGDEGVEQGLLNNWGHVDGWMRCVSSTGGSSRLSIPPPRPDPYAPDDLFE